MSDQGDLASRIDARIRRSVIVGDDGTFGLNVQASALANMVSPLQARELGFVIGSEWREPRLVSAVPALENATRLPQLFRGRLPDEFPCTKSRYSTGGSVVLCFSDCVGQWHRVGAGLQMARDGRHFHAG